MNEPQVDETLAESFPASDPPSWTLGQEPEEDEEDLQDKEPAQPSPPA